MFILVHWNKSNDLMYTLYEILIILGHYGKDDYKVLGNDKLKEKSSIEKLNVYPKYRFFGSSLI